MSNGRAQFGIGEGATRLELHGFDIPAKKKRAMSLEAGEQIANMLTMTPYPGYEGPEGCDSGVSTALGELSEG